MDHTPQAPSDPSPYYFTHSIPSTEYGDYFQISPSHVFETSDSGSQQNPHPQYTELVSPTSCAAASSWENCRKASTGSSILLQQAVLPNRQDATPTPADLASCHFSPQSSAGDPNSDVESASSSCHPTPRFPSLPMQRRRRMTVQATNGQTPVKKGVKAASKSAPAEMHANGLITPAGGSPEEADIPADGYEGGDYIVHYQCGMGHTLEDLKPGDPRYTEPWLIVCQGEEKPCPLGHFVLPKKEDPLLQPNAFIYCPYCGQMMTRSEHMERHIRTHTRVRNMVCVVCTMAFGRSECAKRHMASCHGRLPEDVDPDGSRSALTIAITQGAELVDAVPHPNHGPRTKNSCKQCATSKIKCDKSRGSERCENCRKKNWDCKPQDPKKGSGKSAEAKMIKPGQDRRRKQSLMTSASKAMETPNPSGGENTGASSVAARENQVQRVSDEVLVNSGGNSPEESMDFPSRHIGSADRSVILGRTGIGADSIDMESIGEFQYTFDPNQTASVMETFQAGPMQQDNFSISQNEGMAGLTVDPYHDHHHASDGHSHQSHILFGGQLDNGQKFFPNMMSADMQQHQQLLTPPHSEFFAQQDAVDPSLVYNVPHNLMADDSMFGMDMSTFQHFPSFDVYGNMSLHMQT